MRVTEKVGTRGYKVEKFVELQIYALLSRLTKCKIHVIVHNKTNLLFGFLLSLLSASSNFGMISLHFTAVNVRSIEMSVPPQSELPGLVSRTTPIPSCPPEVLLPRETQHLDLLPPALLSPDVDTLPTKSFLTVVLILFSSQITLSISSPVPTSFTLQNVLPILNRSPAVKGNKSVCFIKSIH